jgi:hypothetical protein
MWPQTKSNPFSHTTVSLDLIHNLIERSILLLLPEMLLGQENGPTKFSSLRSC